jgi:hypothetical protein
VRIWDNSNIVESYEGLTLPLTFSFVRKAYRATFCGAARRFLPLRWRHLERLQVFDQLLGLVDGRVYYNLSSWYVMMAHIPGFPKNKASWEHMVGVREAGQVPEVGLGLLDAIYGASYLAWRLTTARRSAARFFAAFDAYYRRYGGLDLADADAERLAVGAWCGRSDPTAPSVQQRWYREPRAHQVTSPADRGIRGGSQAYRPARGMLESGGPRANTYRSRSFPVGYVIRSSHYKIR